MDIEELARKAGINTKFWNMGAGSVLFVSFVDGIPRSNFEDYTALVKAEVLEQAARDIGAFKTECSKRCAEAIRAMKPTQ